MTQNNHFKRLLLAGSVVTLGLALCSGPVRAQATMLAPDSGWTISRIEPSKTGDKPYCALARRYDQNVILTMARNDKDEGSLAFDFQRKALDAGHEYEVVLDPGYGQVRRFNMYPVSGKAVVVKLGRDYAFYDALYQKGSLNIKIDDMEYNLSMPEMTSGQKKLESCLSGLGQPVDAVKDEQAMQSAEVSAGPVGQPDLPRPAVKKAVNASAQTGLSTDQQALLTELQKLRNDKSSLTAALEAERRKYEETAMRAPESSSVQELHEKVRILESENNSLRNQIADAVYQTAASGQGSCPASKQDVSTMQKHIDELQTENERIARLVKTSTGSSEAMESELQMLREENRRLRDDSTKLAGAVKAQAEAQAKVSEYKGVDDQLLASLREENKQMKAELAALQVDNEKLSRLAEAESETDSDEVTNTEMIAFLEDRVNALEKENADLKQKMEAQAQAAELAAAKALEQELDAVTAKKMKDLEDQLQAAQQQNEVLAVQIDKMTDSQEGELMKLSSSNWNLEQATRRFNESQREIRRLGLRIEQERQECVTEKKELEEMLFDPKIADREQVARLQELEDDLAAAKAELAEGGDIKAAKIVRLEEELDLAKQELSKQRETYEEKTNFLQRQLAEQTRELEAMEARLASATGELVQARTTSANKKPAVSSITSEERRQLVTTIASLKEQNAELENSLGSMEAAWAARNSYEAPVAAAYEPSSPAKVQMDVASADAVVDAYQGGVPAPITPLAQSSSIASAQAMDMPAATGQSYGLMGAGELEAMLVQSGLPVEAGSVQLVSSASSDRMKVFTWQSGSVYGSAEQSVMASGAQFDQNVSAYLNKTQSRCQGDFAAIPAMDSMEGGMRVATYEVACVSGEGSASASLLFYESGGVFTTLAHEAGADDMDKIMDARDRLLSSLTPAGKMAYR